MESYDICTGIWACDLIDSKNIANAQKTEIINQIEYIIAKIKKETNAIFVIKQFRGDGYLIIFDTKDAKSKVLAFAESFCHYFIKQIEDKKIDKGFRLRIYVRFDNVTINDDKVTGDAVDSFCGLVDNKFTQPFKLKEQYNCVLIVSKHWSDELKSNNSYEEVSINGNDFYKSEYEIGNITAKIDFIGMNDEDLKRLYNTIDDASKQYDIKLFKSKNRCNFEISGNSSDVNIYNFFINISDQVYGYYKKTNDKYIIISLDLTATVEFLFSTERINYFKEQVHKGKQFKSYLIWSDICLERFRSTNQYKNRQKNYKKMPMTDQMRAYYEDYVDKELVNRKMIYYSDIIDTRVYLHSFDYCVQKSMKSTSLTIDMKKHLSQQLEIALLLSDSVIIHSAEILRNTIVYDILNDYRNLISNGSISLLFSSKVNNLESDFYSYIEEKISEYDISEYGKEEADSLRDALDKENYDKALDLIKLCPKLLKRDIDGTNTLENLVNDDLHTTCEIPILSENYLNDPDLLTRNYSIRQLLFVKYVDDVGLIHNTIAKELQSEIIDLIDQLVNGVLSASIIKCVFETKITQNIKEKHRKWYQALVNRVNFLYAQVNTGNNLYMEYLPERLRNNLFEISVFYKLFTEHTDVNGLLGATKIFSIRKNKAKWHAFKLNYFAYRMKEKEMLASGFKNYNINKNEKNFLDLKNSIERLMI